MTVDNGTRGSVCFWSAVTGKELGRDPHGLGKSGDIDFIVGIVVLLWTAVGQTETTRVSARIVEVIVVIGVVVVVIMVLV